MARTHNLELVYDLVDQTLLACIDAKAEFGVLASLVVAQNALRTELQSDAITADAAIAAATAGPGFTTEIRVLAVQRWTRELLEASGAVSLGRYLRGIWNEGLHSDAGHSRRIAGRVDGGQTRRTTMTRGTLYEKERCGAGGLPYRNTRETSVSEDPTHGTHTIRASKGGGAGKWLIGALGAAVLAGGGYLAWKNYSPEQNTQSAYNDTYVDDGSYRAGPLPADNDTLADDTASDEPTAAPASSERRAPARRAAARTADIPEVTIGVTPVNLSSDESALQDDDEVVVNPPARPVWASVPSQRRLTSLYPDRALARGREGEARLQCTVLEGGSLDCARVEETANSFGYAAMRVARTLRHAPTREDGASAVGTPVNLRVVFRLEEENRARFASR